MISNIDLIKPILNFNKSGDFYTIYILQRKKDQDNVKLKASQKNRTIKSYQIDSYEYLDSKWMEIMKLCEVFGARAYITIQKKNMNDIAPVLIETIGKKLKIGNSNYQYIYDDVVGKLNGLEKRWIVDIDNLDLKYIHQVTEFINQECRPIENKIITTIPTKNGYHLITHRFDVQKFRTQYPDIEIHKSNPTLLYFPHSLKYK